MTQRDEGCGTGTTRMMHIAETPCICTHLLAVGPVGPSGVAATPDSDVLPAALPQACIPSPVGFLQQAFMVSSLRLLTSLSTLRECIMDIGCFPLFVSYIDSPHPYGSCSRLGPDGCALNSPSPTPPGVCGEKGPKPSACAANRRPPGERAVRSFRFLGKGVSPGLQA